MEADPEPSLVIVKERVTCSPAERVKSVFGGATDRPACPVLALAGTAKDAMMSENTTAHTAKSHTLSRIFVIRAKKMD